MVRHVEARDVFVRVADAVFDEVREAQSDVVFGQHFLIGDVLNLDRRRQHDDVEFFERVEETIDARL
jgi:hypothetical protein